MKRRSVFGIFGLALASAAGSLSPAATSAAAAEKHAAFFIDILYLNEGKTPADAKAYFDKVVPIVAKHGLRRIAPGFVITQKMAGDIDPNLVNLWAVGDPPNTFPNIFSDANYRKYISLRDATFDMSRSHMFMMEGAK